MNIYEVSILAAVTVISALTVKKSCPEIAMVMSVGAITLIMLASVDRVSEMLTFAWDLGGNIDREYLEVPVKAMGISLLTALVSSVCEESGDKSLAFTVVFSGKTAVILTALPLLEELVRMIAVILGVD